MSLADILKAFSDPKVYPQPAEKIDMVQTQMSVVFLAGDYVYKIKKPVNLGYLDYSTLAARKYFCEQEVKLNRRLCRDIYLGVIPITSDGSTISLNGAGETIEYAVKMRKLPREKMLDFLLSKNQVTDEMITRVAKKVAEFHQQAETSSDIGKFGTVKTITINTEENFSQTEKYIGFAISPQQYQRISQYTREYIKKNGRLFNKRVTENKIRDCHGDLHAQHICFTDGICIYDCIEFNDRFRYVDVAAEVSFLAMDIDHADHQELSEQFVSAYIDRSKDKDLMDLLNFYKCYFAYVRAKVNCFKTDDSLLSPEDKRKSLAEAVNYFALAESYLPQSASLKGSLLRPFNPSKK